MRKSSAEIPCRYIKGWTSELKVTEEETEGVPHHLIDILEPSDTFSTADYQKMVRGKITEIAGRGKLPMIVGDGSVHSVRAV